MKGGGNDGGEVGDSDGAKVKGRGLVAVASLRSSVTMEAGPVRTPLAGKRRRLWPAWSPGRRRRRRGRGEVGGDMEAEGSGRGRRQGTNAAPTRWTVDGKRGSGEEAWQRGGDGDGRQQRRTGGEERSRSAKC